MAERALVRATTALSEQVFNAHGEHLGRIEDLMIDIARGSIAYAVLSFGSHLGLGGKLFAIPWSSLRWDERQERLLLDVEKYRLDEAPGFDKDNWPDMAEASWATRVHDYFGTRPYWQDD
jgi:sporulation protein YlmC with PRC-barrel domain